MRKILTGVLACVIVAGASISVPAAAQDQDLQAIIDQAAQGNKLAVLQKKPYVVTKPLKVPNSVTVEGNGATLDVRTRGNSGTLSSAFVLEPGTHGQVIQNLNLNMEHSTFSSAVSANGVSDVVISGLNISEVNFRGISILADAGNVSNVELRKNEVKTKTQDTGENEDIVPVFVSAARGTDKYTGHKGEIWQRYVDTGNTIDNKFSNSDIRLINNILEGGYYGIKFSGVVGSKVQGNTIRNNTRNISMQDGSSNNTVVDNQLRESISSGIHVAYNSDNNHIRGNTIISHRAHGQGILQAYQGSNGNKFDNNNVTVRGEDMRPSWLMYVGPDSSDTSFSGNVIDGAANRAMVGVESMWDGDSAGKDNGHSMMVNGETADEATGGQTSYAGGNGPLKNINISNNTITANNPAKPIFYVGADVAAKKNIVGDIDGVTITNNRIGGEFSTELVTHEGGVGSLGPAKVRNLKHG